MRHHCLASKAVEAAPRNVPKPEREENPLGIVLFMF
jgi:hypothetical protein